MKGGIVALKDGDAPAFRLTRRVLFFCRAPRRTSVYPCTFSSCAWPIFFPSFPLIVLRVPQRGGRRGRLTPLPVGKALMFGPGGGGRRWGMEGKGVGGEEGIGGRCCSVTFSPSSAVRVIHGAQPPPKSPSPFVLCFFCVCVRVFVVSPVGAFKDISGVYGKQERYRRRGRRRRKRTPPPPFEVFECENTEGLPRRLNMHAPARRL